MTGKAILITRPQDKAQSFAAALAEQGYETLIHPFLKMEYPEPPPKPAKEPDAMIITSASAVPFMTARYPHYSRPVLCVGPQSAQALRQAGYRQIIEGPGTAQSLCDMILERADPPLNAVYLRGENINFQLKDYLAKNGLNIEEYIIYRNVPVAAHLPDLHSAIEGGALQAVTLFSPLTARAFEEYVQKNDLKVNLAPLTLLCLSESVLKYVRDLPFEAMYVCDAPNRQAMVDLITRVCRK